MRLRKKANQRREVSKTEAEWRSLLTDEQYRVLRKRGTEAPFSGTNVHPDPTLEGTFTCAACGAELFDAATQFDSGTGWPSFSDAHGDSVERRRDLSMIVPRTEAVCRRCGGHLGHVFADGPAPTSKRYCINAAALTAPAERSSEPE